MLFKNLSALSHRHKLLVLVSLALFAASSVHAIEASSSVKATTILKTTKSWNGALLTYPEGQAEITGMIIEIAPGGDTGWHYHPVSSFGMILEGTLEVTLKDGSVKVMKAGESIAEVVDTVHIGRNIGDVPVKLIVFYAGAEGIPTTCKVVDGQHDHAGEKKAE